MGVFNRTLVKFLLFVIHTFIFGAIFYYPGVE